MAHGLPGARGGGYLSGSNWASGNDQYSLRSPNEGELVVLESHVLLLVVLKPMVVPYKDRFITDSQRPSTDRATLGLGQVY